jgi:hypothetical protein
MAPGAVNIGQANTPVNIGGNLVVTGNTNLGLSNINLYANGYITTKSGIEINNPGSGPLPLKITNEGNTQSIETRLFSNSNPLQAINWVRGRGNATSPLQVQANDMIATQAFQVYTNDTGGPALNMGFWDVFVKSTDGNGVVGITNRETAFYSNISEKIIEFGNIILNGNVNFANQTQIYSNGVISSPTIVASGNITANSLFKGNILSNTISVKLDNISTATPMMDFSVYNNANSLLNPYTFYRARGNLNNPADIQSGDGIRLEAYNVYANANATYQAAGGYQVLCKNNDSNGITINTELYGPNNGYDSNLTLSYDTVKFASSANVKVYANGEINSTGLVTTTGNVVGNNVNATTFVVLSSNTASNLGSVTGVAGAMIAVSDQDYQPAYWSVTDSKWKYVSNRANV